MVDSVDCGLWALLLSGKSPTTVKVVSRASNAVFITCTTIVVLAVVVCIGVVVAVSKRKNRVYRHGYRNLDETSAILENPWDVKPQEA